MREIKFKDVKRLGFKISIESDSVYESQYGFPYKIITYKLRKRILLDWDQITGKCELLICGPGGKILLRQDVPDLKRLEEIIDSFKKDKQHEKEEFGDIDIDPEDEDFESEESEDEWNETETTVHKSSDIIQNFC